jgi:hypothetical protein
MQATGAFHSRTIENKIAAAKITKINLRLSIIHHLAYSGRLCFQARRHPERSRFAGGARDLMRIGFQLARDPSARVFAAPD